MTLQQIAHIKATYKGLKLMRSQTKMFTNKDWGAAFKIEMLHSLEFENLTDYIKNEKLHAIIGNGNLYLQ